MSASFSAASPDAAGSPLRLFGVPFGGFGFFGNMLVAGALGFVAFLAATFFSIFGLLLYNVVGGHAIPLDISYKSIALPIGAFVLVVSAAVLFAAWVRERLLAGRH